jgi:Zn-dependent protease with chaperone function
MIQQLITLRASRRAEYLADAIAAKMASPASMATALDSMLIGQGTHSWILERRRLSAPGSVIWDQWRSALAAVPDSEKERRRRAAAHVRLRLTDTHPPSHLRVRMLQGLPAIEPTVCLSAEQEAAIHAEFAQDYARIGTRIDDAIGPGYW